MSNIFALDSSVFHCLYIMAVGTRVAAQTISTNVNGKS